MKKLIAMLLCVAMIAAFGVNAFAIIDESTPSEKDTLTAAIKAEEATAAARIADAEKWDRVATFYNELEKIGKAYLKEASAADPADTAKQAEIKGKYDKQVAVLGGENKDLAKFVNDNASSFANMFAAVKAVGSDYDWDYTKIEAGALATNGDTYYDAEIVQAMSAANDRYADAANHTQKAEDLQADLQVILDEEAEAAAEAAKAAEEAAAAAKEEAAARRAAAAAVKDPKTQAEWMKYWAAYDKYWLDKDLSSSKDAATKAKDGIKTAQEAAFAQAKNAVERAQIEAYGAMQAEINKAVSDYIAGVQVALGDFYYELYN